MMQTTDKVFVAGGRGLVGNALVRLLKARGFKNVLSPTSSELDLMDQQQTNRFLQKHRPDYVFMAAAKVGGIWANSNYPADFCYSNLSIQTNLIHGSYETGVRKLLFLGSSCIYPKDSEIPIKESSLLTGPLEPTNEAYAVAKITGVKMCDYYRKQFGCDFISVMPTNTYGPYDNFDLRMGHMVPSLIHKFHVAHAKGEPTMTVWGTGKPRRELIYVDDVADACLFLMDHYSEYGPINAGSGEDHSISEIAEMIKKVVGFKGELVYDLSKPDGVFRKVMDVSRIQQMGWKPKINIEDGIRLAYEWFKNNQDFVKVHPTFKKKPMIFSSQKIADPIKELLINKQLANKSLDDPEVTNIHKKVIISKPFLKKLYLDHYRPFVELQNNLSSVQGKSLELGSGGGFLKEVIPDVVTSDVKLFNGVDRVESAYNLSFKDGELKAIYLTGVLHHLGNVRAFFKEADRCLTKGGVVAMMEPHMSWFGQFFFKKLHHEGNDIQTHKWEFPQTGPLSDANTALPSILFDRDFTQFEKEFPHFKVIKRTYHTFLLYGLSGGVSLNYSFPGWTYRIFAMFEKLLSPFMKKYLGTMQTIVLQKVD